MKTTKKIIASLLLITIMIATMTSVVFADNNYLRPSNGWYKDEGNNIYYYKNGKVKTGYFKVDGKTYYGHKTNSKKYPKGSVTKGQMRIEKDNKWYAFNISTGARYDKDLYIRKGRTKRILQLKIRKNHTVKYVYETAATRRGYRYNTARRRWQTEDSNGKWVDYGNQIIPDGWVDFQK